MPSRSSRRAALVLGTDTGGWLRSEAGARPVGCPEAGNWTVPIHRSVVRSEPRLARDRSPRPARLPIPGIRPSEAHRSRPPGAMCGIREIIANRVDLPEIMDEEAGTFASVEPGRAPRNPLLDDDDRGDAPAGSEAR